MPSLVIDDVNVIFPFEPYPIQVDYMSKVIKCCQKAENGLLESPTGTGKTLSLLCSSLAWLTAKKQGPAGNDSAAKAKQNGAESSSLAAANEAVNQMPTYRVVYTSRTHKQLAQAMNELKRTSYGEDLTAICLASRDQYCLNSDVHVLRSLGEKNQMCKERRKTRNPEKTCLFYRSNAPGMRADYSDVIGSLQGVSLETETTDMRRGAVIDIEDLLSAGRQKRACAYYAAQFAASTDNEDVAADVVFCPYNYIFNASFSLSLENAVVIFDEGHNIAQTCEEDASAVISTFTLDQCITGLQQVIADQNYESRTESSEYLIIERSAVQKIVDFATRLTTEIKREAASGGKKPDRSDRKEVRKPPIMWLTSLVMSRLLSDKQRTDSGMSQLVKELLGDQSAALTKLVDFVSEFDIRVSLDGKEVTKQFVTALDALSVFIKALLPAHASEENLLKYLKDNFRVAISKIETETDRKVVVDPRPCVYQLDLFCLNPAVAIQNLRGRGVRSVIITSGTLAPMNSFECELGIDFKHKLCNPHVVGKNQLMILPVARHAGCLLDGSYKASFGNNEYYRNLGLAVADYCKKIPAGLLIFFKSYANLRKSIEVWQQKSVFSEIQKHKRVFDEPRDKRQFNLLLDEYKRHIDSGNGAILVAVYRGKLSEGLDLADDYCRGVIVIGLPFPAWTDPHVELKREYLEAKRDPRLSKDRWYTNQMLRAVNQAIGRIVRHREDYGVVVLIDCSYTSHLKGLSAWLQDFICNPADVNSQTFATFFKTNFHRKKAFNSAPKSAISLPTVHFAEKKAFNSAPKSAVSLPTVHFADFLAENGNELKTILQKDKIAHLLATLRELRDTRDSEKFATGIQEALGGLPRVKRAKYTRGISMLLEAKDRLTFLQKFGLASLSEG